LQMLLILSSKMNSFLSVCDSGGSPSTYLDEPLILIFHYLTVAPLYGDSSVCGNILTDIILVMCVKKSINP